MFFTEEMVATNMTWRHLKNKITHFCSFKFDQMVKNQVTWPYREKALLFERISKHLEPFYHHMLKPS